MNTVGKTLIDLFELNKLPPEKANEMTERLSKLVLQAMLIRVLPMLSEKDLETYEKIVENKENGAEVMFQFLGEKIPGLDGIIQEEAEALRADLAGEFEATGI